MLELLQAFTGYPTTGLQFLVLQSETLLLYPYSDCIIILNARTLTFLRALAFWEAFPGTRHSNDSIRCLAIDPGMKLVVASMGSRIATWTLSNTGSSQLQNSWRLHATLLVSEDQEVTALDCKSGLLAVSTRASLSVYTLILENDLPTWSCKWTYSAKCPICVRFSPSLMYIAAISLHDNTVRLHSTTSGRLTQAIPHPRPVTDIHWRQPTPTHSHAHGHSDDPILYTTTADGTLRIFLPVLDEPQRVQLHAALDAASAVPFSSSLDANVAITTSAVFPLERGAVLSALKGASGETEKEDGRSRRVREIAEEGWDLFLRVLADGSLVVQAVANIDRRPPTLLRHFTLLQSAPGLLPSPPPSHLYVLSLQPYSAPVSEASSKSASVSTLIKSSSTVPNELILVTSPPLASYSLAPIPFFDARADGLTPISRAADQAREVDVDVGGASYSASMRRREVLRFVRTPEGEGVAAVWADGGGETCRVTHHGRRLEPRGKWMPESEDGRGKVERVAVLDEGRCFVTYSCLSESDTRRGVLTLHTSPPAMLTVPPLTSLFCLPLQSTPLAIPSSSAVTPPLALVGITAAQTILVISVAYAPEPRLSLFSESSLPISTSARLISPVDPMAWSGTFAGAASNEPHDVLLSVSEEGELAFWVPEAAMGRCANGKTSSTNGRLNGSGATTPSHWRCTGRVRTGRKGMSKAACSSAKKSVLAVPGPEGEELTIWDSKISEFSSGLEYREVLSSSDPINDLDWTATPDSQSILAIGFAHRVELLCQQRMTYFDETPAWGRCWTVDVGRLFPHPISDSIWLTRGSLLVGSGHILCLFGQPKSPPSETQRPESLFEHVARENGPLFEYHPQMILQCLLWEKIELVKKIIVNLAKNLENGRDVVHWKGVPLDEFFWKDEVVKAIHVPRRSRYNVLFSVPEVKDENDEDQFSRSLVEKVMENLGEQPLPNLTPNEQASLLVLIQATLEIEEQRRALDANGLRYLISMRVFYITRHRMSTPGTPASIRSGTVSKRILPRERLRYRDIIWAFHSESQELLLSTSMSACGGKMTWSDARALGVFLWMRSAESMKSHMEVLARNQYMAGDNRDPTACSLFYFALGKSKLVHGLWRQAAWHKEQAQMLKFLNNDFTQPRWRTAALKNAFALLSKRRFEYAAAFFLLGNSLKDAVNVCIRNLSDFQLAVALARVIEQGNHGPVLKDILENTVVPLAFQDGNRWLASWAFWLLHRRDLAVRILVTPLEDIAAVLEVQIPEIGEPHYDDPSLALLFSQLKSRTLQTAKGTSEISGRTEFNFVLQIARVFCRMGCHVLALDLVRTWSFERPSTITHDGPLARPPSPVSTRFALEPALRRRSSIFIDMDPVSAPPTRKPSPERKAVPPLKPLEEELREEPDLIARKAGLGSLMKSAKQDVQVPEFDMNAFF